MKDVEITAKTRDDEILQWWAKENERLFLFLARVMKKFSEASYNRYKELRLPMKLGDLWGCRAINFNYGDMTQHKDGDDYEFGYCTEISFGDYTDDVG